MGCDIDLRIEYQYPQGDCWIYAADFNLERNYKIFAAMAGVRAKSPDQVLYPARGLPPVLEIALEDTPRLFQPDGSLNPFNHSHSWLTRQELERCVQSAGLPPLDIPGWHALLGAMAELERIGLSTRVVFWFYQ